MSDKELDYICDIHFYTFKKGLYCPFCKIEALEKRAFKPDGEHDYSSRIENLIKRVNGLFVDRHKFREQIAVFKNKLGDYAKVQLSFEDNLAELRKYTKVLEGFISMHAEEINKLKERFGKLSKGLEFFSIQSSDNKEVLQEEYKFRIEWCIKAINMDAFEGILRPEQITHLEEQVDFYKGNLEKLDSNAEKKESHRDCSNCGFNRLNTKEPCFECHDFNEWKPQEDSEVLKDIKELAKAESDFYDKHGYYSFWSDKLKAQRIEDSGGEKEATISGLGGVECSSGKSTMITSSKLPEPHRKWSLEENPCEDCKHEFPSISQRCKDCCKTVSFDGFEPKEKTELTKKTSDSEPSFICKKCGDPVYINNYRFKGSYYCIDCMIKETEPALINTSEPLYPKVVYQLGTDSKEYIELKEKYDKLIEDFQTDLDSLSPNIPYQYEPLRELKKKWEEKAK